MRAMRRHKDYIVFQEDFFGEEPPDTDYVPPFAKPIQNTRANDNPIDDGDDLNDVVSQDASELLLLSWSPKRPPPPLPLPLRKTHTPTPSGKRRKHIKGITGKGTNGKNKLKDVQAPDMSIFGKDASTCHNWTMAQLEAFRTHAKDASWTDAQHIAYARVRRKIKNRISAANSRKRRHDTIKALERENARLVKENESLRKKLKARIRG